MDAGRKRAFRACGLRAISNGMDTPTLFPWRPVLVRGRTPIVVSGSMYEADDEPAMRCIVPSGA